MDTVSPTTLAIEAGAVGIILLVVFVIIHIILMAVDKNFSMGHLGIFAGVFLAGALGHVVMEYVGANKYFIESRLRPNN